MSQITKDNPVQHKTMISLELSYLPDPPPSCTSSGLILQLLKVSSISVYLLRRSLTQEKYGQKTLFAGVLQM